MDGTDAKSRCKCQRQSVGKINLQDNQNTLQSISRCADSIPFVCELRAKNCHRGTHYAVDYSGDYGAERHVEARNHCLVPSAEHYG